MPELNQALVGLRLLECFSQQKDELILGFADSGREFFIKADLKQSFTCLSIPNDFSRARKNSVDLFQDLKGMEVKEVKLYLNERCFSFNFDTHVLLFKMYGNRSNIILFNEGSASEMFKNRMEKDLELKPEEIDREIDQSFEAFEKSDGNLKQLFPTLGKLGMQYLKEKGGESGEPSERWERLNAVLEEMESGPIYRIREKDDLYLSLFPMGEILGEHESAIEAISAFYGQRVRTQALLTEKKRLISELNNRIQKTGNYLKKIEYKLNNLSGNSYREVADLIMANLHAIPPESKSVTLDNFYTGKPTEISLNQRLSPQKNAERYYRKAKNQKKEEEVLRKNIQQKSKELGQLEEVFEKVNETEDLRIIRELAKPYQSSKSEAEAVSLPYKKIEEGDFEILIGKNAKANDELTFSVAQRTDLWLHARDVAGSHVVIRSLKGQPVPNHILEKAAGLAAYHSKRKTDSLCPVIYVERKYVRKFKGSKPGQVRVDHEKVIMVKPLKA